MAAQYWIGDFFVDLTRNQITQKTQSQTIPPKALAVLTYLAKNANRVVSHDELLSDVWPDTVVTPNTLQRSIAQLRKALGEDSQYQSYIKTHAKQGYSLEVEVRWQDKTDAALLTGQELIGQNTLAKAPPVSDVAASEHKVAQPHIECVDNSKPSGTKSAITKPTRITPSLLVILAAIVIIGFIGVKFLTPEQSLKSSFVQLRSLTATDNKELGGIYSPDGQYVVFHRYSEAFCTNNIWAKDTKTQKETQLTKNMAAYGSHSFSKDGKQLVFIKSQDCNKPITQKKCYQLMSFDFQKALDTPQSGRTLMECKNTRIIRSKWLNNNNVALMQEVSDRWQLTSYSIANNKSTVIYSLDEGNLIDFDYSAKDDLIALTSIHNDGQHYIEILKPDGQILSSHQIEYPKEIPNLRFIYPNFTPQNEQLIFSTGRQLFTLSYEGKVTNISLLLDEPMGSPIFHPNGKRMLMIKGHYDSDIMTMSLSQLKQEQEKIQTEQGNNYSILERSIVEEGSAIFQPNGQLIAFKSARSGDQQLWITDGNGSVQLTNFPIDSYIYGMDWAADGQSILVNVNDMLTQVNLDSSQVTFELPHPVALLFQFNSEDDTALVIARIKGVLKFVEFNLNNLAFRVLTDKKVNWALKSEDGRLVYTDHMDRFWQSGPAEDQLIDALEDKGSTKQRFEIKDNVVYGINDRFQLWSYDLDKDTFEVLKDLPKNIDSLTDINQTQLLMTVRIASKKEVAELILID